MVGSAQGIAISLVALALATVVPTGSGDGVTYCSDSKPLGEPVDAQCVLEHPDCVSGCDWPDVHVRVWANEGTEGALTPVVTGAVRSDIQVCQDIQECQGSHDMPSSYGTSVMCMGYGVATGRLITATDVVNAPTSIHMECWIDWP